MEDTTLSAAAAGSFVVTLQRQSGLLKAWRPHVYVQRSNFLQEFAVGVDHNRTKPREIIDLTGCTTETTAGRTGRTDTFQLNVKPGTSIHFMASSKEEKQLLMQRWNMWTEPLSPTATSFTAQARTVSRSSSRGSIGAEAAAAAASGRHSTDQRTLSSPRKRGERRLSLPDSTRLFSATPRHSMDSLEEHDEHAAAAGAIVLADAVGVISEFNQEAQHMFGWSLAEVRHKSINMLMPEPYRAQHDSFLLRYDKTGVPTVLGQPRRVQAQRRNGEVFPIELCVQKMLSGRFQAVIYDLSQAPAPYDEEYRRIESVRLRVIEGKNLMPRKNGDWFCSVMVDSIFKARTSTQYDTNRPMWGEDVVLYDADLPLERKSIQIIVNTLLAKRAGVKPVGKIEIPFQQVHSQELGGSSWFRLQPHDSSTASSSSKDAADMGSLHLELEQVTENILPLSEYQQLLRLVIDDELVVPRALAKLADNKLEEIAGILLRVFASRQLAHRYVKELLVAEIQTTENASIIFRGNSLATKSLDLYMKMVGMEFLTTTLRAPLQEIYSDSERCEIDPARMQDEKYDLAQNQRRLLGHVQRVWTAIQHGIKAMPVEMSAVFQAVREHMQLQFGEGVYKYTAVSGFLFLRFFGPAILSPYIFQIMNDQPEAATARTLTLIAKTLQNLANLVEFGDKEPYMIFMNTFIVEQKDRMCALLDKASGAVQAAAAGDRHAARAALVDVDVGREMARLHRHMSQRLDRMKAIAAAAPTSTASQSMLNHVFAELDRLDRLQQHVSNHTYTNDSYV